MGCSGRGRGPHLSSAAPTRSWLDHRILALTLASLVFWTGWNVLREDCHPFADLSCGFYTDHFSHMNLTRVFPHAGLDIYRVPRGELFPSLSEEEKAALPDDLEQSVGSVYGVEGWPADKPFATTWIDIPSFYPPGDLVLFAPPALLYHHTGISWSAINLVLIEMMIVGAHLTLYLALVAGARFREGSWIGVFGLYVTYSLLVHWALEGFYDSLWVAPLVLTGVFLAQRRGLAAVVTISVALFLHFRAYFYVPWALYALYVLWRDGRWKSWSIGRQVAFGVAGALGVSSLYVFWITRSAMAGHRLTNDLNPDSPEFNLAGVAVLVLVAAALAVPLIRGRAWLDLAMVGWTALVGVFLPEVNQWDAVAFVPWLVAPTAVGRADARLGDARTAAAILLPVTIFGLSLDPAWVELAFERLFA